MIRLAVTRGARTPCGVRDYAARLAAALPDDFDVRWIDLPDADTARPWGEAGRRAAGADVVHVHYEYGLFRTVKPWRNHLAGFLEALPVPAVVTLHGELPRLRPRWGDVRPYRLRDGLRDAAYLPFFRGWERREHGRAAHWLAQIRCHHERVAAAVGVTRVDLAPHPIPRATGRWSLAASEPDHVATPGFTKPHKGHARFLRLVAAHAWRWTLAGGPQDAEDARHLTQLRAEVAAAALGDRVTVTGYLGETELDATLGRARLVVLPYERGGGSGALARAIAIGAPVAVSDLPCFRESRDAGAGLELLPAGDAAAGEAVAALLRDPERLEALAARNRDYASHHTYEASARQLAPVLRHLAARR